MKSRASARHSLTAVTTPPNAHARTPITALNAALKERNCKRVLMGVALGASGSVIRGETIFLAGMFKRMRVERLRDAAVRLLHSYRYKDSEQEGEIILLILQRS